MTTDQVVQNGLESSPVPHSDRAPRHAEDCVVDIRDLEDYIRSSNNGEAASPFCPAWKQAGASTSNSLCGAVGSLASMPFRYLSRSNTTTKDKRSISSDGCSTSATEEAICAFTPFLPESSSDFLRSENSSDSHDANSYPGLPQDPRDELEPSLSALSISQSLQSTHEPRSGHSHAKPSTGATPGFSWVGALKDAVTGGRSGGSHPRGCTKPVRCAHLLGGQCPSKFESPLVRCLEVNCVKWRPCC